MGVTGVQVSVAARRGVRVGRDDARDARGLQVGIRRANMLREELADEVLQLRAEGHATLSEADRVVFQQCRHLRLGVVRAVLGVTPALALGGDHMYQRGSHRCCGSNG